MTLRTNILKVNSILSKKIKSKFLMLFFLILFGMVLEVFGIGLLIPILKAILEPETLVSNIYIISLADFFHLETSFEISKFALIFLLLLYFFKAVFLILISYLQNKFISSFTASISNKLFSSYLNKDYQFHLITNSSILIKNIQLEISNFTNFLISFLSLFTEVALAFSIILTLFVIEPLGTIIAFVFFGLASTIFHQLTKKKVSKWGLIREELDGKISKNITEALSGVKEVKLSNSEFFFVNNLETLNQNKAVMLSKSLTLRQIPRFYLELLSVFSLTGFVFVMLFQNKQIESVIVILGVFVAATFRILPSINRILSSLQNIKYYQSSIDVIFEELVNYTPISNLKIEVFQSIEMKSKLSIKQLEFYYLNSRRILKNINVVIHKGSTVGIIGQSGAGKSTLVNIISGLFKPSSGTIVIDEKFNIHSNVTSWQKLLGYVSQEVFLIDDSIINNVAFGVLPEEIDEDLVKNSLLKAQLLDYVCELSDGLNTRVGERGVQLSGGQKQRLGIARALYRQPEILILDEATSALDIQTENEIMNSLENLKGSMTILIVTHRHVTLNICDSIYSIENGYLRKIKNTKNVR